MSSALDSAAVTPSSPPSGSAPQLDVVVPVRDEQTVLEASIRRLHAHLSAGFPFTWRIVIADNGSADGTPQIAHSLAAELPRVAVLRLDRPGRGGALRAAWSESPASVVAYMDSDLSTDLAALLPLVAPLFAGHGDLAIGSRLAPGARVVRSARRETLSRGYNALLSLTLRARFSDAQCGFKALRVDAARRLLGQVRDDGWFFDTELLVRAQHAGLRLHEVPVDWVEDPESSVRIVPTVWRDLCGVARLLIGGQVARFMAVGLVSTLAYALLYLMLRGPLGAGRANALALAVTAVANTAANRRLTFGVRGAAGLLRQHALGAVVYAVTLGLTSGALDVLGALYPRAPRLLELAVLVTASIGATVTRYAALHTVVFAGQGRHRPRATLRPAVVVHRPVHQSTDQAG